MLHLLTAYNQFIILMQKQLTEEEVNRIVEEQMRRLEDDYALIQQFNVLPSSQTVQTNPQISQILKKQFTDDEMNAIINSEIKDYELTKKFDAIAPPIKNQINDNKCKQQEQQNDNDSVEDNPYQMMGNEEDGNELFSDTESDSKQNQENVEAVQTNQTKPNQEQIIYSNSQITTVQKQDQYKPEQAIIDTVKIMQIANKMDIKCPDWMNDSQLCEKRLKQLFSKK